jgi:hypothetical protein
MNPADVVPEPCWKGRSFRCRTASLALLTLLLLFGNQVRSERRSGPSLAILNARVWTGNKRQPWAQAVAVTGDQISAVGTSEEIRKCLESDTRVIDGNGNTLLPGLIDAHFHILNLPAPDPPLNLMFVASKQAFADRVARYAAKVPAGAWIVGEGWNERKWGGELPSRDWIDAITPRHPVWLTNEMGDAGLANSLALQAAGITRATLEPPEAVIARDARGEPTGLIRGGPMWLIDAVFAERDREAADRYVLPLVDALHGIGVTSVHHTGSWQELLALRRLHKAGRLGMRIYVGVPLRSWRRLRDYVAAYGRGDPWLHWGGLKLFQNTWSEQPRPVKDGKVDRYSAQPSAEEAYEWFAGASRAGLQIMVHAGGYPVLKFYERIQAEQRLPDPRFRIEHAHDIPRDWIALYARAGVIASVQPSLLSHFDIRTAVGAPPPTHLFPCRELLDAGVTIAFGTDAVTASRLTSPFEMIQLALERPDPDGRRLTLEECLRACTRDAAYAEFAETEKGSIEPGKLADLVLIDRDVFRTELHALHETQVCVTIIGGQVRYERSPTSRPRTTGF